MKKILALLFVLYSQLNHACNCEDFSKVQKRALLENKFILVHFSYFFRYESNDRSGNPEMNAAEENADVQQMMKNFLYVCVSDGRNANLIQKYKVKDFPALLIIDANGTEVYRFKDFSNSAEFVAAIQNFSLPSTLLAGDMQAFHKKETYHSALRIAQQYMDYSLFIDPEFKNNVYNAGKSYIHEAEKLLSKNEETYAEKKQKLELIGLFHWAYEKNFSFLDQELAPLDEKVIFESNANLY